MSTRSYVDHWPHTAGDLFVQFQLTKQTLGPITDTYIDHWPEDQQDLFVRTDLTAPTTGPITNSYVDHFPKDGDLNLSSGMGVIQGL